MIQDYDRKVREFETLLTEHQRKSVTTRHPNLDPNQIHARVKSGRKYDKVVITSYGNNAVRYFIDRHDGSIYGARSYVAPNFKWYFGTLDTAPLWDWGDFHARPVNDDSVIVAGVYAGYVHYMKR